MIIIQMIFLNFIRLMVGRILMILLTMYLAIFTLDYLYYRKFYLFQSLLVPQVGSLDKITTIDALNETMHYDNAYFGNWTLPNESNSSLTEWEQKLGLPIKNLELLSQDGMLYLHNIHKKYTTGIAFTAILVYTVFMERIYRRKLFLLPTLFLFTLLYVMKSLRDLTIYYYIDEPWELETHDIFNRGASDPETGVWVTFEEHVSSLDAINAANHEGRPNIFLFTISTMIMMLTFFYTLLLRLELVEQRIVLRTNPTLEV